MFTFIIVLSGFVVLAGLFAYALRKSNVNRGNFSELHRCKSHN
jgi:uncharacterized membrane protein